MTAATVLLQLASDRLEASAAAKHFISNPKTDDERAAVSTHLLGKFYPFNLAPRPIHLKTEGQSGRSEEKVFEWEDNKQDGVFPCSAVVRQGSRENEQFLQLGDAFCREIGEALKKNLGVCDADLQKFREKIGALIADPYLDAALKNSITADYLGAALRAGEGTTKITALNDAPNRHHIVLRDEQMWSLGADKPTLQSTRIIHLWPEKDGLKYHPVVLVKERLGDGPYQPVSSERKNSINLTFRGDADTILREHGLKHEWPSGTMPDRGKGPDRFGAILFTSWSTTACTNALNQGALTASTCTKFAEGIQQASKLRLR